MIKIIAGSEAELSVMIQLIAEQGLPQPFYQFGYVLQIERNGVLRSAGGGGIAQTTIFNGYSEAGMIQGGPGGECRNET